MQKDKLVMFLVRKLVGLCLSHNILFKALHIIGTLNSGPDFLSRLQLTKFKELMPGADDEPEWVPPLPPLPH